MSRSKNILLNYSDHTRFPIRETICDFDRVENIPTKYVELYRLGVNIRVRFSNTYIDFSNCDYYRINAPYFNSMDKFEEQLITKLKFRQIIIQKLLF